MWFGISLPLSMARLRLGNADPISRVWRQCCNPLEQDRLVSGPSLLEHLESIESASRSREEALPLSSPVGQRPNLDFRGLSGTLVSGSIRPGAAVAIAPSGKSS